MQYYGFIKFTYIYAAAMWMNQWHKPRYNHLIVCTCSRSYISRPAQPAEPALATGLPNLSKYWDQVP